jgi:hypothetical protein
MASKFRIPFKNAVIAQAVTSGAGSAQDQPLRNGGLNGVNLWGTGKGQGVPAGYAMIALDGVAVLPVVVATTALKENDPIYITAANVLNNTSAGNTLFGYADEPGAVGTVTIGVRISNAVGA